MKRRMIIISLLLLISISIIILINNNDSNDIEIKDKSNLDNKLEFINEEYASYKSINDDYIGQLVFESNIINEPVLQAKGSLNDNVIFAYNTGVIVNDYDKGCEGGSCSLNDVYLRKDINNNFDIGGTVFMDYRNSLSDQNILIYGHLYPKTMDPNKELMFSPLESLLNKDNYENNKYVSLKLKKETKNYQVVYVYLFNLSNDDYDNLQYFRTNYNIDLKGNIDEGYYDRYINNLEQVKLYDTGIKLNNTDNTLTLQTCYEEDDNILEIVVCKEISK